MDAAAKSDREAIKNAVLQSAVAVKNAGNQRSQGSKGSKYEEALFLYTETISKLQKSDDTTSQGKLAFCYQSRAAAYERLEMYDEAIEDATKAIELNDSDAKAYFIRAKAYVGLNKVYCAFQDGMMACISENFRNKAFIRFVGDINARFGE